MSGHDPVTEWLAEPIEDGHVLRERLREQRLRSGTISLKDAKDMVEVAIKECEVLALPGTGAGRRIY